MSRDMSQDAPWWLSSNGIRKLQKRIDLNKLKMYIGWLRTGFPVSFQKTIEQTRYTPPKINMTMEMKMYLLL